MELVCLVDFRGAADWRSRKAEQYPEDNRNKDAQVLLERLADQADGLEGSSLHQQVFDLWHDTPEVSYDGFHEVTSELLRSVGFHYWPADASQFLEDLLASVEYKL